ncbi:MAG: Gfo/Idh/MocA family oxidoreductase [Candidatus Glassbacteria bacterium]
MKKIRTAVIGVGHLGSQHARIYSQLAGCELAGVYDSERSRAEECAHAYGVKAFDSLEAAAGDIEAASLAVPTDRHYEIGRHLLEKGIHLLVEKPITSETAHARELVETAREKHLVLAVGHVERFNPVLVAAADEIADTIFVESERLAPFTPRGTEVPVVLDLMIHDIDIILSLIRQPVAEVSAVGLPVFTGSVDIADARLVFENGAVAKVSASRVSIKKVRKMRFFSRDSYVSVDLLKRSANCYRKKPGADIPLDRSGLSIPEMSKLVQVRKLRCDKKREPLALELENFIDCVARGSAPVVSGEDGFRALEVAGRIMQAIERSLSLAARDSRQSA